MKHTIGKIITPNTLTTLFIVPQGYIAEVDLIFINNHTASAKTASVLWSQTVPVVQDVYLIFQKSLNAKDVYRFGDGTIVLQQGDAIKIQTEAASDFTAIATFDLRKEKPLYSFI